MADRGELTGGQPQRAGFISTTRSTRSDGTVCAALIMGMEWSLSEYRAACATATAAAVAYYTDGSSDLSDGQFDALVASIAAYEADHDVAVPFSSAVGSGVGGGDIVHAEPMLSLDNVFDAESLSRWLAGLDGEEVVVEPKLDGLAVAVDVRDGVAWRMATRGDGTSGEDVSFALPCVSNLPVVPGFTGQLRGEAVFTRDQFDAANVLRVQHGDSPFVNARNGVAGALRGSKDRGYVIPFSFFVYDVVGTDLARSHGVTMDQLAVWGFSTARHLLVASFPAAATSLQGSGVLALVASLDDPQVRAVLPVETDGLVVKVDNRGVRGRFGSSSRAPRWAVAYKFAAAEVVSTLVDVGWQVGRTGVVTPRARIVPVFVGGTTIEYATLHSPKDLARKGFMLGDQVVVKRAGEVIPRLDRPLPLLRTGSEREVVAPQVCPQCGGPLDVSQVRIRCARGRDCGVAAALAYAVGRDALDIEGLGSVQVANLVAAGVVADVASIFEVGIDPDMLVAHGKVAPANAVKIAAEVVRAKSTGLARVLTALGVRGTGRSMSRRLARRFGSMEALMAASLVDLAAVDGVGDVKAALIRAELDSLRPVVARLEAAGVSLVDVAAVAPRPAQARMPVDGSSVPVSLRDGSSSAACEDITGWSVCVTGAMRSALAGLSRTQVQELVESHGGKAVSSVSRSTDLLVVGENAGSKLSKAQSLGVRVVSEPEFAAMLGLV